MRSKAYDGPHQTTTNQSTPHIVERKHPLPCLTDVILEVVILLPQSSKDVKDSLYSTFTLQKYKKEVSVQNKFKFILEKEGKKQLFGISEHLLFNANVNLLSY